MLAEYLLLNKNIIKRAFYPLTDPHSANRSGQALGFVLSLRLQNFARDDKYESVSLKMTLYNFTNL